MTHTGGYIFGLTSSVYCKNVTWNTNGVSSQPLQILHALQFE